MHQVLRAGHAGVRRRYAAGTHLLLCRRAPSSARHALRSAAGQRAEMPGHNYRKDGAMRFFPANSNADAYYEPNSFGGPVERPDVTEPPLKSGGDTARYNQRIGNDDFGQPRALLNLFDAYQKQGLFANIAACGGVAPLAEPAHSCGLHTFEGYAMGGLSLAAFRFAARAASLTSWWEPSPGPREVPRARQFRTSRERCRSRRRTRPSHKAGGWSASSRIP